MSQELDKKNKRTILSVFCIVIGMVALSFAAVPLYDLFCRVTGFGGTTQLAESAPDQPLERVIRIRLNGDTAPNLPWRFYPEKNYVDIQIGQKALVNFKGRNMSAKPTAGTALYNVTPLKAGKYFKKIQCFCFDEQVLNPGQEMNFPVVFFVDPDIVKNKNMNDIKVITLSYSFFKTDTPALEQALEAFYDERSEQSIPVN